MCFVCWPHIPAVNQCKGWTVKQSQQHHCRCANSSHKMATLKNGRAQRGESKDRGHFLPRLTPRRLHPSGHEFKYKPPAFAVTLTVCVWCIAALVLCCIFPTTIGGFHEHHAIVTVNQQPAVIQCKSWTVKQSSQIKTLECFQRSMYYYESWPSGKLDAALPMPSGSLMQNYANLSVS